MAPSVPVDVKATLNKCKKVDLSWKLATGFPVPTYDIYEDNQKIDSNVTSPYERYTTVGAHTYAVEAVNTKGVKKSSNVDGNVSDEKSAPVSCLYPSDCYFPRSGPNSDMHPRDC